MFEIAWMIIAALVLDIVLAEPKRWHPLVGFGGLASRLEAMVNTPRLRRYHYGSFIVGIMAWIILVILPTLLFMVIVTKIHLWLSDTIMLAYATSILLNVTVLYLAIGYTSLRQHAMAIVIPLTQENIVVARQQLARIVSRDTSTLDEEGVSQATIESVLENGNDAIFAAIFWFVIGGIPAVIIYRLSNTLDAMWGYKTERFLFFGRFSARIDDILNYLPSRLVAVSYAVLGHTQQAFSCWQQQSRQQASPNGGVVMTSGAGALNVLLGGDASYHGKLVAKPLFGCGVKPECDDIQRSLRLIDRTVILWCAVCLLMAILQVFFGRGY